MTHSELILWNNAEALRNRIHEQDVQIASLKAIIARWEKQYPIDIIGVPYQIDHEWEED